MCTGISAQYILYTFVDLLDVNVFLQVAYIKILSDLTWVLKQTPRCIFCYRALLYNFVIKFQYRCLFDLVGGCQMRSDSLRLTRVDKSQAVCTWACSLEIALEMLGPCGLGQEVPLQ